MGTDDRNLDRAGRGEGRDLRERRHRRVQSAEPQAGGVMKGAAQRGQRCIAAGRRDEGDACRRAVPGKAHRHGERAHIEQIDEIGVAAEQRVPADRVAGHLGQRHRPRRSRHHHRIDALQRGLGRDGAVGLG